MNVVYDQFTGINNVQAKFELAAGRVSELTAAVNCDVNDRKKLQRRPGFASLQATATHSLFSDARICLYRQGTALYRLLESWAAVSLKTGLTAGAAMSYAGANERIFMSDGVFAGWTDGTVVHAWGIEPPATQPAATQAAAGALPLARYHYAVTYLREDGEESGTGVSGVINCRYGIDFTSIPVSSSASVTRKAIYLSLPNSELLYRVLVIPNATTSASYTGNMLTGEGKVELTTQFKIAPPPGRVLAQHNSRMLVGWGPYLMYSDPYRHELFDHEQAYGYDSNVRVVVPMKDGVLVGTEKQCIWMAGGDAASFEPVLKANYGAVHGSAFPVEADSVNPELSGNAAMFGSVEGVCLVTDGGTFRNLTTGRYEYDTRLRSAALFRRMGKLNTYLLALR
jgi:hypothetical protein